MSVADLRFFASELFLIFGRRRNWAGLAVLAAVPVIMGISIKVGGGGDGGPDFFSSITDNGFFLALAALGVELGLFLPIAVAAISADAVAGEANTGTLRYLLSVPVQRTRLLVVKYAAVVVFTLGILLGLALFGGGPVTLLSGSQIPLGEAVLRLLAICVYLTVGLAALGAIGLFVSTLTEQPIGATIAIVMLSISSFILDSIPQLEWLHPYLLTHWWTAFGDLLRAPVEWGGVRSGLASAAAYIVIFTSAAWARFAGKDVTS
jgi:ABC-2 type transport system permease protein